YEILPSWHDANLLYLILIKHLKINKDALKYELMGFKTRNAQTLEEDVCKILAGFGKDYRMTCC
ncbi:MAG: hypothetical protein WCK32_09920, partial [Chlorobiaceae bacterium]